MGPAQVFIFAVSLWVGFNSILLADQQKNNPLKSLPKDTYHGTDKFSLKQKMQQVMVQTGVKNSSEVVAVSIPSNWKKGAYNQQVSQQKYRKITGVILWRDNSSDQLCRYDSYYFIQEMSAGKWSPLRFDGFCDECEEGEVECLE